MKLDTFKKLIREVVREEVRSVIREELTQFKNTTISPKSVKPSSPPKTLSSFMEEPSKPTTLDSLIKETAQSMNKDEYRTMINADSSMVHQFAPHSSNLYQNQNPLEANIGNIEAPVPDFSDLMKVMKEKNMI